MLRRTITIFGLVCLLGAGLALGAEAYTLDASHSHVGFSVRHFGVSNVRGEFKEFSGTLMVDEEDLTGSSIEFRIKTDSIDTDHEQRDEHLRSDDFLASEEFPEIVFKSKKIEKRGDEHVAIGDLTIRDKTHEIELPFEIAGPLKDPLNNMRLGAEGAVTVDRQDYGVNWSRTMDNGGLFVGNDVKISFSIEATRPLGE
jgi:polyisoprenoid-binding protein YceI